MTLSVLPHIEFIDDNNFIVNVLFSALLGTAAGILLSSVVKIIYDYLKD